MNKFTKGQWVLDTQTGNIRTNDHLVAQVYGATEHNINDNAEECFANARLILNAPKLYYILRPLFEPKTLGRFSDVVFAIREAKKVIEAIDAEGGKA
mgnify:CR=1 FL=1